MSCDSSQRFSDRVENYVKYRPGYPKKMVKFICDKFGLNRHKKIADIGSGTGISSKLMLETGSTVFGVEPNDKMRQAAERYLAGYENFRSFRGTAEKTGIESQGVDVISAFQAFHWFDNPVSRKEFRRILRKDGCLILVWNERQLDSSNFLREYERLLVEFGTDYQKIRHDRFTKESIEESFGRSFATRSFAHSQTLNFKGLKGRTLSASYAPNEGDKRFKEMQEKLAAIFSKNEEKGRIRIPYETNVFYGMI